MQALLIPVEGPLVEIETLDGGLSQLQGLVNGNIEAVPMTPVVADENDSTVYVNEEGKFTEQPNMRATDFMVPGVGIFAGDYIAGPMVLAGFDPNTGEHAELPQSVIDRARLIEEEAG